jgi:predicted ABC-type ATPase
MANHAPRLFLIGGPNGSGKSTFARGLLAQYKPSLPFVNTDEIAREIGDWRRPEVQIRAARESLSRMRRLLRQRKNFVHETTLSGRTQIDLARQAKQDGWYIDFTFVFVRDWTLSADRVASRVQRGGHDVSAADIERRFARSLENFWVMLNLSDEWQLFDNSGATYAAIASGTTDEWIVYDHATFQALEAFRGAT